jgi:hypothetical protein
MFDAPDWAMLLIVDYKFIPCGYVGKFMGQSMASIIFIEFGIDDDSKLVFSDMGSGTVKIVF